MSAVVVFAKGSYPYKLVYDAGNTRLKQSKQLVKSVAADVYRTNPDKPEKVADYYRSAVSYLMIHRQRNRRRCPHHAQNHLYFHP